MEKQLIFGYFTLRVCVYSLAFGFFSLGWSIIMVNVLDFYDYKIGCSLALLNALSMIGIWGLALYSAMKASYGSILASTVLWSVFSIFWFMLVLISCIESTSAMLVNHRGPESIWLLYNKYNLGAIDMNYEYYDHKPHEKGICFNRLSSAEKATSVDGLQDGDGIIPPRAFMSKTVDYMCMKWLLIILCFLLFSYIICGAWYVLYGFCKEINYDLTCVCPAMCNLHV